MFLSTVRAGSNKSKYVVVQLASVISGTTAMWVRLRGAPESAAILFDPAIGQKVLFKESRKLKGVDEVNQLAKFRFSLPKRVDDLANPAGPVFDNTFVRKGKRR